MALASSDADGEVHNAQPSNGVCILKAGLDGRMAHFFEVGPTS